MVNYGITILIYPSTAVHHYYTSLATKESKQIILNYIREQKGEVTKNDVVRYMESNKVRAQDRTSRKTTLSLIEELDSPPRKGPIMVTKGERQGQSHKLVYNDKNNLNVLTSEIDRTEELANAFCKVALDDVEKLKQTQMSFLNKHIRNLIHVCGVILFTRISTIASSIATVRNRDDREALYLRLTKVYSASTDFNNAVMSLHLQGLEEMLEDMVRLNITKDDIATNTSRLLMDSIKELKELSFNLGQLD